MNQKHVTFPLSVNTHTFVINSTFNITTEKKKYQSTKQWDISFNTQQVKQTVVTLQYLWCKYRKQNFRLNAALQKLDNKFKGDVNKKNPIHEHFCTCMGTSHYLKLKCPVHVLRWRVMYLRTLRTNQRVDILYTE